MKDKINKIKKELIKTSLDLKYEEEFGISEEAWNEKTLSIAMAAYEDQCSPANPRVPMVSDMVELLKRAYKAN